VTLNAPVNSPGVSPPGRPAPPDDGPDPAAPGGPAAILGVLDVSADRAVFRQIADHLRAAIESGRLTENDRIPSETRLVEHYGVARMTVRHAIGLLQAEGLVLAEHGRGVFVRPRPPVRRLAMDRFARRYRELGKAAFIAEAERAGAVPSVDSLVIREERPSRDVAARLGSTRPVAARHRRYLLDDRPVETAVSYIPLDLARGTAIVRPDPGPGGIYARLEELGHPLGHFDEEVRARMPVPGESRALQLPPGVPVFQLIRTAFDADGRAVEVCDTVMAADVYVLAYSLPAS
jgi:GntR family transcriptional regulator